MTMRLRVLKSVTMTPVPRIPSAARKLGYNDLTYRDFSGRLTQR